MVGIQSIALFGGPATFSAAKEGTMRRREVSSRNRLLGACLLLFGVVVLRPALAQPASMVKDINTTLDETFGLQPQAMVAVGSRVFLSGTAEGMGIELWTSDGTSAGTVLIKDIWPGAGSSSPTNFVAMG